jgi:hypothetical protein
MLTAVTVNIAANRVSTEPMMEWVSHREGGTTLVRKRSVGCELSMEGRIRKYGTLTSELRSSFREGPAMEMDFLRIIYNED